MIVEDLRTQGIIQCWVEKIVVGLNLCPFAALPLRRDQVRIVVSDGCHWESILTDLLEEAFRLNMADPAQVATTLVVVPDGLRDFIDFNEFHGMAEGIMTAMGLEGVLQLASFHPNYQFADSQPGDVANYTNRAPFPVLHLLREAELGEAVARHPDPARIYQENIHRLESLGLARLQEMLGACRWESDDGRGTGLQ